MIKKPQLTIDETLPKTLGVQIAKTFVARLGDPAQGYKVKVDSTDKKGLVYIHGIGDTPNSAYTAENRVGLTELLPRSLVEVGYTETGRFKIVGFAPENSEYIDGVNINDQTPVYRNQILDGGLIANDSNNVQYIGTYYVVNGIVYLTSDQTTGNLIDGSTDDTSAVAIQPPSTPQTAIVVLVQINPVTNVISYKQSSAFPASYSNRLIASNSLYPQPDDNNAITGYIRLINGVTTIKQEHITSLPDIYRINRGEANTASNIGIDGVGVFDGKVGVDLQFRNINAGSTKISVTDDSANNEIDIDVSESDLTLDNIGGTLSVAKGGTGSTNASGARANLDAQEDLSGAIITSATVATDDKILIQDTDDSDNLKTVTVQSVADLASTITTPVSSTDNAIVRFDGTGGDSIQNSGVLIDDNDRLTLPDSTTIPPLNITERSAAPTTPASNDIYLDDGTNTASGQPNFFRYNGSSWEELDDGSSVERWVMSRLEQLTTNGTGYLGTNENFSGFTLDQTEAPTGVPASFRHDGYLATIFNDDLITIDPNKVYRMQVDLKQETSELHTNYVGIHSYDIDELFIMPYDYMYLSIGGTSSYTTLAQPLTPGDTTIYLTDATGWNENTYSQDWNRTVIIFEYKNSLGYTYDYYSRINGMRTGDRGLWDYNVGAVDKVNHTVTLNTGFPANLGNPDDVNGTWPIGTRIANGSSGGTYIYSVTASAKPTDQWQTYTGWVGGVNKAGISSSHMFRPGTAFIKWLFLPNYSNRASGWSGFPDSGTNYSVWFANLSIQEDITRTYVDDGDGSFSAIDGLTLDQLILKENSGHLSLRNITDTGYANITANTGTFITGVSAGGLTVENSETISPLNITERSAAPTTPASNDIYLDDGTNTSSGNPSFRRYTGSMWEDIGGGSSGSLNYVETTTASATYFTTSTSPTAIDTTNLRLSITTTGGRVFVGFVGSRLTQNTNYDNINYIGVLISSTYYAGAVNSLSDANVRSGTPANFLIPINLGAGTHTIDLAFYTANATTAVNLYEADMGLFYAYEM